MSTMFGTDHLPSELPIATGRTTGFSENFFPAKDQQYVVDSLLSIEAEFSKRYYENIDRVRQHTGQDLSVPLSTVDPFRVLVKREMNRRQPKTQQNIPSVVFGSGANWFGVEDSEKFFSRFDENEAKIRELKQQYPDIQTFDELLDDMLAHRKYVYEQASDAYNRAGFMGTLGAFAGGVVGSFSERDPILVGSMFLPTPLKTLVGRLAMEAGYGAGAEAVQQYGGVQQTYEMLGEEGVNPLESIAYSAVGGVAFRAAGEAAGPAYKFGERYVAPNRARARAFDEFFSDTMPDMPKIFETMPQNPAMRAARYFWEADRSLREANPYGTSDEAMARITRELAEVEIYFNGDTPPRPFLNKVAADKALDVIWSLRGQQRKLGKEDADFARAVERKDTTGLVERRESKIETLQNNLEAYARDLRAVRDEVLDLADLEDKIKELEQKAADTKTKSFKAKLLKQKAKLEQSVEGGLALAKQRRLSEQTGLSIGQNRLYKMLQKEEAKLLELQKRAKENSLRQAIGMEKAASRYSDVENTMARSVRRYAGAVGQRVTDAESYDIARKLLDTPSKDFARNAAELLGELRARPQEQLKPIARFNDPELAELAFKRVEKAADDISDAVEKASFTFKTEEPVIADTLDVKYSDVDVVIRDEPGVTPKTEPDVPEKSLEELVYEKVGFDVPSEEWLKEKQFSALLRVEGSNGQYRAVNNPFAKLLRGSVTAYTKEPVMVPVNFLSKLWGANNENLLVPSQLDKIHNLFTKISSEGWSNKYPILVQVNQFGDAFIAEGNTRVRIAHALGIDEIPVVIEWINGGERVDNAMILPQDTIQGYKLPEYLKDNPNPNQKFDKYALIKANYTQLNPQTISLGEDHGLNARKLLMKLNDYTGIEHHIIVDAHDGYIFSYARGDEVSVSMPNDIYINAAKEGRELIIHHNHPEFNQGLSFSDLAQIFLPAVKAIYAYSHTRHNDWYRAEASPKFKAHVAATFPNANPVQIFLGLRADWKTLGNVFDKMFYLLAPKDAVHQLSHIRTMALRDAGFISYNSSVPDFDFEPWVGLKEAYDGYVGKLRSAFVFNATGRSTAGLVPGDIPEVHQQLGKAGPDSASGYGIGGGTGDATISLGAGHAVQSDMMVPVDHYKTVSVKELMLDIADDADMVQATKVCSL